MPVGQSAGDLEEWTQTKLKEGHCPLSVPLPIPLHQQFDANDNEMTHSSFASISPTAKQAAPKLKRFLTPELLMLTAVRCPHCATTVPIEAHRSKVICRTCGWSEQVERLQSVPTAPEPKAMATEVNRHFQEQNVLTRLGWVLFVMGALMLGAGLVYDTTGSRDVHNIGLISERDAVINIGGFLAVCGSIFIARTKD